jgi:hypothetical protein
MRVGVRAAAVSTRRIESAARQAAVAVSSANDPAALGRFLHVFVDSLTPGTGKPSSAAPAAQPSPRRPARSPR